MNSFVTQQGAIANLHSICRVILTGAYYVCGSRKSVYDHIETIYSHTLALDICKISIIIWETREYKLIPQNKEITMEAN